MPYKKNKSFLYIVRSRPTPEDWVTIEEIVVYLNVSPSICYGKKWKSNPFSIPSYKNGRNKLYKWSEVIDFLKNCRGNKRKKK